MIEPQSMQDGASAWFTKLETSFPAEDWAACVIAWVVALPEPPATAPAAWAGVWRVIGIGVVTRLGRVAVGSAIPSPAGEG